MIFEKMNAGSCLDWVRKSGSPLPRSEGFFEAAQALIRDTQVRLMSSTRSIALVASIFGCALSGCASNRYKNGYSVIEPYHGHRWAVGLYRHDGNPYFLLVLSPEIPKSLSYSNGNTCMAILCSKEMLEQPDDHDEAEAIARAHTQIFEYDKMVSLPIDPDEKWVDLLPQWLEDEIGGKIVKVPSLTQFRRPDSQTNIPIPSNPPNEAPRASEGDLQR